MRVFSSSRDLVLVLACSFSMSAAALQDSGKLETPYDQVDTLIGTAGGGNTFPGATLPFGMVQWSPDTNRDAWYRYDEKAIQGFSLTHISGAGCSLYGDFGVLPVTGELNKSPGKDITPYAAAFAHSQEETHPGYYAVTLSNGVKVELVASERAGIARFTFPAGTPSRILINAGSSANVDASEIALGESDAYAGSANAGHFCGSNSHYKIYAAGQFDRPVVKTAAWQDDEVLSGERSAHGKRSGLWVDFGDAREVQLKVGISFVSEEGARNNLAKDIPRWDFDAVYARARASWSELLNRFRVEGGTDDQKKIFYTGVYHSFLSPNAFSDADGRYAGFDGTVHAMAGRQKTQYANFSDWDIYRNTVQLQALFEPERASDMMQSLVNDAAQGGQLPRWEAANDVTYVMGGDSPAPVIASSYAFGARNFDAEAALKWMEKAATDAHDNTERPFLEDYLKLGYVPVDSDEIAASRTLEYASDDFAIAQMAKALGDQEIADQFLKRSRNWKSLVDPETKWIRPRNSDGTWLKGFDSEKSMPKRIFNGSQSSDQKGFEEGNTWQYSFMIPFDYPVLFAAMGGESAVVPRLDRFFLKLRCWGQPCYNIENEPDFVVPYAYVFAGQPWKTQEVVTRVGETTFKAAPDGIPGNDDLGATSGVYVWDALGMYPAVPGVAGLVLGTPMFSRATLKLSGGRTLEITRSGKGVYVSDVQVNARPYESNWLPTDKIRAGVTRLRFTLQSGPNIHRGTSMADRPPPFR